MSATVIRAETLNLPEAFASKFKGLSVELVDNGDTITIKPVHFAIDEAFGMTTGSKFTTEAFMEQKRLEKELEYGS